MEIQQRNIIQKRINILSALAWLMIFGLILAYARIQLWKGREMKKLALSQAVKTHIIPAPRGIIYDRNGNKLVDNQMIMHLIIQHENLPKDSSQIEDLALALNIDPEQLKNKIAITRQLAGNRMLIVQDSLNDTEIAHVEVLKAKFPFLEIETAPRRVYVLEDRACHALGYVSEVTPQDINKYHERYQLGEVIGRTGIEEKYNDELRGTDGQQKIIVNSLGREVATYNSQEIKAGKNVYLTLDIGLQDVLKNAFGQLRGAGVVLDLKDGGILALYSNPSYDSNIFLNKLTSEQVKKFLSNPDCPMLNRVIQGCYPPASTFKTLVAITALEKGLITPNTTITCHGHKSFYGRNFRCDGVHGTVNLTQALAHSCDIYFYELGARLDIDEIYHAAKKYGLIEPTGIDLPNEVVSRVPNREWKRLTKKEKWFAGETISVAIGQGANGITPIALARFYAMIATHGKLLTPHLLYGFQNDNSDQLELYPPHPTIDTGLKPSIWAAIDEALFHVVQIGTARRSALPGVTIVGKTGTSQVTTFVDRAHYVTLARRLRDNALFAGYAPRENPQIAFAIVAENAGFGACSAAPIARQVCKYWFIDRQQKQPLPATKTFVKHTVNNHESGLLP